jgi:uncharacterized protein (DUF427 family)
MKAIMNGRIIAESDATLVIENNHYFPPDSVHREYLHQSDHRTTCPWKGEAHYFDVIVDGKKSRNAAWTYPQPKEAAKEIKDYLAFWRDVQVTE